MPGEKLEHGSDVSFETALYGRRAASYHRRMKELWRWEAAELARAIRAREISSREAVESCLARIDAVNPRINAIVDLMADEALQAAGRADDAVKKGAKLGALHGV